MSIEIPIFPTLYIINNNKKLYKWSIKIEPKEGTPIYIISTSHGEKDGKQVVHKKDIDEGKAKRTVLEQAILDANRKWQNKRDKELYAEKIDTSIENGSKKINVRPMLANKFSFDSYTNKSRAFKISFPAYIQKKYDGIRCISYMKDNEVILESRKGIPFQNFGILKNQLKELFKKLPQNFYFDGELYTDKLDFEVISGLIRLHEKSCTPEDLLKINMIQYHIYDYINLDIPDQKYEERYNTLTTFMNDNILATDLCKPVETILVDTVGDVKVYHDKFVKDGYEGIMIRDRNGIYEANKRSKYLQKFKEFFEEEFKIVGYDQGTGDEKGAVVWNCVTNDNKPFAVRPKGTFESRKILFENGDKYIGKQLTVIFQEYSTDGIPRFAIGKGIRDIY